MGVPRRPELVDAHARTQRNLLIAQRFVLTQDVDPNIQSGLVWTRSPAIPIRLSAQAAYCAWAFFRSGQAYGGGSRARVRLNFRPLSRPTISARSSLEPVG